MQRKVRSIKIKSTLAVLFVAAGLVLQAARPTNMLAAHGPEALSHSTGLAATVRIEHRWDVRQGSDVTTVIAYSLGTVIGPQTILTHNHFDPNTGKLDNEWMTVTESDGDIAQLSLADMALNPMDGGTMLLDLPTELTVPAAPIADWATLNHLAVGDWLTIIYWDDPNERLAQQDFQIIKVAQGIAILADPERIINSGDSGGGAYIAGKLVGNTWRITTDTNDRSLGRFTIALVPAQVTDQTR
jgi:hypothetical protein